MKTVCIFSGTTEGRQLAHALALAGIYSHVCVATEYGEEVMEESSFMTLHTGRMDEKTMREFLKKEDWYAVVDATHPFATQVSKQIKEIMQDIAVPFFRLQRNTSVLENEMDLKESLTCYGSVEECAQALLKTTGNILLTTGSKELARFCEEEAVRMRLYARVLPGIESIELCKNANLSGKQILALQGPFSEEMNLAMIHQYHIEHMVTKQSGKTGGVDEKLLAAKKAGIHIHMIGNPETEKGFSFCEVAEALENITKQKINAYTKWNIKLCGVGMGSQDTMTLAVKEAIEEADIVFGAKRMIAEYEDTKITYPYYLAEDIIPVLDTFAKVETGEKKAVVIFSGDSGFCSGAQKVYEVLNTRSDMNVTILPGISTISALSAKLGISWQDACLYSIHGKENWQHDFYTKVQSQKKLFLLLSGKKQLQEVGSLLKDFKEIEIMVACNLSYPDETVLHLTAAECETYQQDGLLCAVILHNDVKHPFLAPSKKDEEFIRDKVPMTKAEIREVSICKLHLQEGAVLYDIGSGTGSIAVEAASLSPLVQVYALEQKKEAVDLIKRNCEKFKTENVTVIHALAPDGMDKLPAPTHAFIGGSKGNLFEIIDKLYEANPYIRIVINAVSLETVTKLQEIKSRYDVDDFEMVQLQANRVKELGNYHLMQADNPVMICSFSMKKM